MTQPVRTTETPQTPDADEQKQRAEAARIADAELRLEGLALSSEAKALRNRWVKGELTDKEWLDAVQALCKQPADG